ncbi:hypothetical protein RDWZM_010483 [Blomia tropicalis]|uniref:TLC domain-containing protein n=1 Tax=Blomia tropicalis TaxID=40697 RepID=A0A9Q0LZJ9_BLOTA|nr:hypothetical protein RDWZM_010483 [Blomia tropicalis]
MTKFTYNVPIEPHLYVDASYYNLCYLSWKNFRKYFNYLWYDDDGDQTTTSTSTSSITTNGTDEKSQLNFSTLLYEYNQNVNGDLMYILMGALILTFVRLFLINRISSKLVRINYVATKDMARFSESMYNHLFYLFAFILSAMVVYQNGYLTHPERIWQGYELGEHVPTLVWAVYTMEAAHYLHCLFAVQFINSWSTDSHILFLHHIIALMLITISYFIRTYRIGVLVLFLHDVCDIIMDGCKMLIKLRLQNPLAIKLVDIGRNCSFLLFVAFWFTFRLYYFPIVVLYAAVIFLEHNDVQEWVPFQMELFILLLVIFAMNVYWATLILKMVYNAICGQTIDDIREIDENDSVGDTNHKVETPKMNGHSKKD